MKVGQEVSTQNFVSSITYYSGLHGAISFQYWCKFLPSKDVTDVYNDAQSTICHLLTKYEIYDKNM